jgi:hypothetical protein
VRLGAPVFLGQRFARSSPVTVTLTNGAHRFTRTIRSTPAGSFVVRFAFVAVDPCRGTLTVVAVDRGGNRARWTHTCRPPSTTDPYPA